MELPTNRILAFDFSEQRLSGQRRPGPRLSLNPAALGFPSDTLPMFEGGNAFRCGTVAGAINVSRGRASGPPRDLPSHGV